MQNPLLKAQNCILYDTDFHFITKTRFSQETPGALILIFQKEPEIKLPEHFYLVPFDPDSPTPNRFRSFDCTWSGTFSQYTVNLTEQTYWITKVSIPGRRDVRQDLRIYVSFDIDAFVDASDTPTPIVIKDMSAGGLMFVSSEVFEVGTFLSFPFTRTKTPIHITAEVVSVRPTAMLSTLAYGCRFMDMSKIDESLLRKFIFSYDLLVKQQERQNQKNQSK